jgi:hypothetical protein
VKLPLAHDISTGEPVAHAATHGQSVMIATRTKVGRN